MGMLGELYAQVYKEFRKPDKSLNGANEGRYSLEKSPACQAAFDTLKEKLTCHPVLAHPQFDKKFFVATDASDTEWVPCWPYATS
jgi:hypothetical protein